MFSAAIRKEWPLSCRPRLPWHRADRRRFNGRLTMSSACEPIACCDENNLNSSRIPPDRRLNCHQRMCNKYRASLRLDSAVAFCPHTSMYTLPGVLRGIWCASVVAVECVLKCHYCRQRGYVFGSVCSFGCWFFCQQDYSKSRLSLIHI